MQWVRPKSVPVGQVWSRFKGKERDGQPAKMYQIRDFVEKYRTVCLDLMQETFLRDEPLCHVLNIPNDPESIETIRKNWETLLDQQVSLACFTEVNGEPDELVGFNIVYVKSKGDPDDDIINEKGKGSQNVFKTLIAAENMVDVFARYGVDKYLSTSGLTVLPGHRGQNIGARIMAAREPLCKALGIKATCTVFTAITSQVLAAKNGYEVLAVFPYSRMKEQGVDLSRCTTQLAKVMGIKYNF
ncbi:hypothetical protein ACJJTC_011058 [Scirpophaga incertulas]